MSTETPEKQRDNLHEEDGKGPRFGYSGSPEEVQRQQSPDGEPSDSQGEYNPQITPKGAASDQVGEFSSKELSDKEQTAQDEAAATDADKSETAKAGLYSGDESSSPGRFSRARKYLTVNPRRKITAIAVTGALAVAGIGGFGIIQGPLKIVHLGELLSLPGRTQADTNSQRIGNMYRYVRTGSYGETRLGNLESVVNKKIISDFEKEGIVLEHNKTGRLTKVSVDPRTNTSLRDLSPEERKAKFAETYGVNPENVRTLGGGKLEIDTVGTKTKFKTGMIKASFGLAGKGKVSTAVNARIVTKFFGEFSIFHPMKKIEVKIAEADAARAATRAEKKKAREDAQRTKNEKVASSLNQYDKTFLEEQKAKIGDGQKLRIGAGAVLSLTGALCTLKDISENLPRLQYLASVVPAMAGAYYVMGNASQVKSGNDFAAQQAGDFAGTMTDKDGKSVFSSRGINELAGKHSGIDLDEDTKSSFSDENKAASVNAVLDKVLGLNFACSTIGGIFQAAVGIGLLVGTGGLGTIAFKTTAGVVQGVAVSRVINYIEKRIVGPSVAKSVLSGGDLGGGLLAQGAMWAARSRAMNFGGVAFSTVASEQIRNERIAEYKQEFSSRDLISKVFDATDSRSLAAAAIDSPALSRSQLSNVASIFSFNNLFSGVARLASGKAYAAERTYDWGAPEFGFSSKVLDDPKYQDPYDNADKVAAFIDGSDYIEKAKTCFGAEISKDDSGNWNVVTVSDVNPATGDYKSADCADESDANWIRVRLFILDTKNMAAFACSEGDATDPEVQKACADSGVATAAVAQTTNPAGPVGSADMTKTITVKDGGKFITLPKRYSCPGRTTQIDARIAPALTYILDTYNMCADDGLANGHKSHGAGLGVDVRPRDQSKQNSKDEWKGTAEAFLHDINWWGDSADQPKSSKGCAKYSGYGSCVGGATGPTGKIPQWVRWLGYNGDVDHGDPWHVFGGSYGHIHIGWESPNHDAVSPSIISSPISEVYTFPAPIADDLRPLLPSSITGGGQ